MNGGLNVTNGLSVIPESDGDVTLPSNLYYNYPLYWKLPDSFLGDKVIFQFNRQKCTKYSLFRKTTMYFNLTLHLSLMLKLFIYMNLLRSSLMEDSYALKP